MQSINKTLSSSLFLVANDEIDMQSDLCLFVIAQPESSNAIDANSNFDQLFNYQYHNTIESFLKRYHHFNSYQPYLLLLDVGLFIDLARELPVLLEYLSASNYGLILLVNNESDDFIASSMAIGVDDYFFIGRSSELLTAKINAQFKRLDSVTVVDKEVQAYSNDQAKLYREQALAKDVFDRVTEKYHYDLSLIDSWLSPAAIFNGDILLKAPMPNGGLIVLLGDFTGHGLTAAIGAMPLASSFYAMVAKGFTLRNIIHELNEKLYALLPSHIFCCAAVVQFDFAHETADIWNGGLPDVVIQSSTRDDLRHVASSQLPLGVVDNSRYQLQVIRLQVSEHDRVWLLSDGLLEARNALGENFGSDRFLAAVHQSRHKQSPIAWVKSEFDQFSQSADQADDVSLVQICMLSEMNFLALQPPLNPCQGDKYPSAWRLSVKIFPASLKYSDPIPQLLHQLMVLPAMRRYNHSLFTVLTELYNNALDHGLLRLTSELKSGESGFDHFYAQRKQALAALLSGWIELSIDFNADKMGASIQLDVKDSGAGFDLSQLAIGDNLPRVESGLKQQTQVHGRGIALVGSLCERLDYLGCGNHARALMQLSFQ